MSDLTAFRDHARGMAKAVHRPDCLVRSAPWLKAVPTAGCTGCVTDDDRALWKRLAAETDAYLSRPTEETLL